LLTASAVSLAAFGEIVTGLKQKQQTRERRQSQKRLRSKIEFIICIIVVALVARPKRWLHLKHFAASYSLLELWSFSTVGGWTLICQTRMRSLAGGGCPQV
jgi:hypothetical protein